MPSLMARDESRPFKSVTLLHKLIHSTSELISSVILLRNYFTKHKRLV